MAVYFDFNPRLGELRRDLCWLAHESGVSIVQLRRHQERRSRAITWEALDSLCRALNCQPGEFMKREEEERRAEVNHRARRIS